MENELSRIIKKFDLKPLEMEGGYYCESIRSTHFIPAYESKRRLHTAIYYLLTPDTYSCLHRLPGDEVYHFYWGDPVELILLNQNKAAQKVLLGSPNHANHHCQYLVPGGTIQGSRLSAGGSFALMGTTMSPGFEFEDFQLPSSQELDHWHNDVLYPVLNKLRAK